MPICRICRGQIDKKKEKEGVDWCMPSRNWYYHVSCYTQWKSQKEPSEDDWILMIYDFLARDLKVSYNYFLCEQQRKKFWTENHINNKGVYFTLKYFYEVKRHDWVGNGGIGIVPYVFEESKQYWADQERKQHGFMEALEQQLKAAANLDVLKIKQPQKRARTKYNLDAIKDMD